MMDRFPKPPEELMQAIARDLRPVRPSPQPLHLAMRMAPLALLVSSLVLVVLGIRHDSGRLGPFLTWGASAGQFLLAIALVWIAAHESTPASRLPREIVCSAAIGALSAVAAVTLLTYSTIHPIGSAGGSRWSIDLACGAGSTIAGGVLVVLFSWMFRRSIAARPTLAGALYGAGAGIAINASWRIACPGLTLRHTLGAHGTAILATMLLGALIGRILGARRLYTGKRHS